MFVNGVQVISTQLENISLDYPNNMQQKSDRPPMAPKQLPILHLTPASSSKRSDSSYPGDRPGLLKPQHDIPPTPPPQQKSKSLEFFQQRIG